MNALSNSSLREAYEKAVELDLDDDFIIMIEKELSRRITKKDVNRIKENIQ